MSAVPPLRGDQPSTVRPSPCPSCPYRLNAPSGVWAASEYERLPDYDGETTEQVYAGALALFHCHSTPLALCAGWVGHRDPHDLLALRLGVAAGAADPSCLSYRTRVPLWPTGAAAAEHGLRDVAAPGRAAVEAIRKVSRLRGLSPDQPSDSA